MTVKRTHAKEDETTQLQIVKWGMSTNVFRATVLILVLSMHPLGRQVLGTFGFKFPDEQKLTVAAQQATDVHADIANLQRDVSELKDNATKVGTKLDRLDTTITGFQVDFAAWKKKEQPL